MQDEHNTNNQENLQQDVIPEEEPTKNKDASNNEDENESTVKRSTQSPVSVEDVKAVLFDDNQNPISPFRVGIKWVHDKIGHGSYTTIQKRLKHIRDETNTVIEAPKIDTPPVPTDVAATLWKTAWEASRTHFLEKCTDMSAQNDQLRERCEMLTSDVDPVLNEIAELERELARMQENKVTMIKVMRDAEETHSNEIAEISGQLQESRTQIKTLTELIEKNIKPQK